MSSESECYFITAFSGTDLTTEPDADIDHEMLSNVDAPDSTLGLQRWISSAFPPPDRLIEYLINRNKPMWELFLANRFTAEGAVNSGKEFDPLYSKYAKQNYHYLLEWSAFRAHQALHRGSNHRTWQNLTAAGTSLTRRVGDALAFKTQLSNHGIEVSAEEPLSHALIAYTRWQELKALTTDVFTTMVLTIPCVYGWHQIARRLEKQAHDGDIKLKPDTLFYKLWYTPSLDPKIGGRAADDIQRRVADLAPQYQSPQTLERWVNFFGIGCQMELALFDCPYVKY